MDAVVTDPAVRMRAYIDQHTDGGPYVPRLAASEIVEKLRANEPELLARWLDDQAEHFVWQMINDRDRSRRSAAVHSRPRGAFADAARSAADGDVTPLRQFSDAPYTVADGSRRALATLAYEDLAFVADDYDRRAARNAFHSAFMRALAKKVTTGTVGDHFTEEQLAAMWSGMAA